MKVSLNRPPAPPPPPGRVVLDMNETEFRDLQIMLKGWTIYSELSWYIPERSELKGASTLDCKAVIGPILELKL